MSENKKVIASGNAIVLNIDIEKTFGEKQWPGSEAILIIRPGHHYTLNFEVDDDGGVRKHRHEEVEPILDRNKMFYGVIKVNGVAAAVKPMAVDRVPVGGN